MNPPAKTRILFVDDEEMILDLLKLSLASMRHEWEMRFVDSGEAALALIKDQPFDIVVSDMRMPRMSGAQLLNEVMKRFPATIRIILSGYAEQEQVLKCVGATHQFLTKPFNLDALKTTLNRCRRSKARLPNAEIQKLLARRDRLPSIPTVYFQIVEALQAPDCPAQRLGEIVATDPALTAKILQLVNSAFFGFAREISSPDEAVLLLGVGTIRALVLTLHLFSAFKSQTAQDWPIEQIWSHSLRVGRLARKIAELEGTDQELWEQTFTAGLLHDAGKLLLADNLATVYLELYSRAAREKLALVELERGAFGVSHAEVGAYLLDLWGLPAPLVEAVALHHAPTQAADAAFSPLTAVHVANVLEAESRTGDSTHPLPTLDTHYLAQLKLEPRLPLWREKTRGL